ncbi:hypothetical protein K466DRAFT_400544 [Polyporus arcularius HHB13444]|uniref:Uncharacterized protein n=1 Tax=Polyporus arcularius HHB13444 TaxID=1314778 RepID=A0A5C3PKU2_9APHY|nr:hypothetical protein K466DRAFT_400544 [Polyporus arcularius HHB13444]
MYDVWCMVYGVWEVRMLRSGYMVRDTGCGVRARFWLGISISIWCGVIWGGCMYATEGAREHDSQDNTEGERVGYDGCTGTGRHGDGDGDGG